MPSGAQKEEKLGWKSQDEAVRVRALEKLMAFSQQWVCERFYRAGKLVAIWKRRKMSCPLKLNNKSAINLHEHTLFWLQLQMMKFSHQNANMTLMHMQTIHMYWQGTNTQGASKERYFSNHLSIALYLNY